MLLVDENTANCGWSPICALAGSATSSETVAPSLMVVVLSFNVCALTITAPVSRSHDVPRAAPLAQARSVTAW